MKKRLSWHRVLAPTAWRPKLNDELVGTYLGTHRRAGQYGEYSVHIVRSRTRLFYVSGSAVNDLFSVLKEGATVRVVYRGTKELSEGRQLKQFELYTEEQVSFTLIGVA